VERLKLLASHFLLLIKVIKKVNSLANEQPSLQKNVCHIVSVVWAVVYASTSEAIWFTLGLPRFATTIDTKFKQFDQLY